MRRFKASIKTEQLVEVKAGTYSEAMRILENRYDHPAVDIVEQIEPWVEVHWYDLHRVSDVLVFERALPHRFTMHEVDVLKKRCEQIGLRVVDSWNGAGRIMLCLQVEGRRLPDDLQIGQSGQGPPLEDWQIGVLSRPPGQP